jgi:hypothetical protein
MWVNVINDSLVIYDDKIIDIISLNDINSITSHRSGFGVKISRKSVRIDSVYENMRLVDFMDALRPKTS